jgi:hypothetical protein
MNKKKTPIDYLVDAGIFIPRHLLDQAQGMFQEQIEDAYWDGGQDIPSTEETCKQYYNETFGDHK